MPPMSAVGVLLEIDQIQTLRTFFFNHGSGPFCPLTISPPVIPYMSLSVPTVKVDPVFVKPELSLSYSFSKRFCLLSFPEPSDFASEFLIGRLGKDG